MEDKEKVTIIETYYYLSIPTVIAIGFLSTAIIAVALAWRT